MRNIVCSMLSLIGTITGCAQEKKESTSINSTIGKMENSIPFLTKDNKYIYVDKTTLEPIDGREYKKASLYTSTGYTVVYTEEESILLDINGKEVLRYEDGSIYLRIVNGLTFYKKDREYKRKMPFWKWEWNILGGGVQKEQDYHSIEVGVVDTQQILLQKEVPRMGESYYLDVMGVDADHVFWNDALYEIKHKRLSKKDSNIINILEGSRFIKEVNNSYNIYSLHRKKAICKGLQGSESVSVLYAGETITLTEVNKERYMPEVPKLLMDNDTKAVYAFPQYDKVFPKEIKKATAAQIAFIKQTTLVYSIANSPYFLLGVFNYNHDIWSYSWLYIDIEGNVLDNVEINHFKVEDQIGYMVWPSNEMILPSQFIDKEWKVKKLRYYGGSKDLYQVKVNTKEQKDVYGIWNSKKQQWDITPQYYSIRVLDNEKEIYAFQQKEDSPFVLYDNKKQKEIGVRTYQDITTDGMVQVCTEDGRLLSYYINIDTGREYRE